MGKKELVRDIKAAALERMENAVRTVKDFKAVIKQWNHLDKTRERREREHEIGRSNEEMLHWDKVSTNDRRGKLRIELDTVIPRPLEHPFWRQLIRGDFIDTIYDNANEMWQIVGDRDIYILLKGLTRKQKDVVFLRAVRSCTPQQIACYQDKTDRAVRKLFTVAITSMQDNLAPIIRKQIIEGSPKITLAKRRFIERYDKGKTQS